MEVSAKHPMEYRGHTADGGCAARKVRRFIEAGGIEQIVAGANAGSPLNYHASVPREIAHLVDAGLSPMPALQSATLRPAQMRGVDDRLGTIAVGKLPGTIVVDGNPFDDISLLQGGANRRLPNSP
ncbi:MAG: amidohydrolase family protein [Vicinamibacteria bacterium]